MRIPDTVDSLIGKAGTSTRRSAGSSRRSRTSSTRASGGCSGWCTPRVRCGEDDAVLAQHFATGYTKIAGTFGGAEAARYLAAKSSEDPGRVRGQIEMLRDDRARQLPRSSSTSRRTPRSRVARRPHEHAGAAAGKLRAEIMELFTVGVGNLTESDVYAGARVFTGWNLQRPGRRPTASQPLRVHLQRRPARTTAKTFSSPSIPTATGRFRRAPPPAACRTASI